MADAQPEFIARGLATAAGLVITIASAVPLVDKRLARVAEIETDLGELRGPVRPLYIWLQKIYKFGLALLAVAALGAAAAYAVPDFEQQPAPFLRSSGDLILAIWLFLGLATYTNLISWAGIGVMWSVSAVAPLRALLLNGRRVQDFPTWSALRT